MTTTNRWAKLGIEAHTAGMAALKAVTPRPMTVRETHGSREWHSEEGLCGFAWINVRPGNCGFARWAKSRNLGHKGYHGGYNVWVRDGGMSVERKEAYARAYAAVLTEAGIKAYANSKLD